MIFRFSRYEFGPLEVRRSMSSSLPFPLALLALALSLGCEARSSAPEPARETKKAEAQAPDAPKLYGEPLPDAERAELTAVLQHPENYTSRDLLIEGDVKRACSKKGCWMELSPSGSDGSLSCRVTFKDYAFFVPTNSPGKRARLVGQVSTRTLSRAHTEHLEAEGARIASKNPDGSAVEVQIVARGVELR